MRLSQLFTRTSREVPSDETSKNAQLLIRGGFVHKTMAGVYSYLPLGLRVLNKIENIVRKHMNAIGGQEILMNSLHPKSWWEKAERWDSVDVLFKLKSQTENDYALAPTHEEQISPILASYIKSYKDLPNFDSESQRFPVAVYQIQTKFRDELRSKAGLMRGREFRMKDMYDFHISKTSQNEYFEFITRTYHSIYKELGLQSYAVDASGGDFSDKFSREFQAICQAGEDTIVYSKSTGLACNVEVLEDAKKSWLEQGKQIPSDLTEAVSCEVGNIFDLGQKWTKAFGVTFADENNAQHYPYMGCHGIGTSRCMGVIAEIHSDDRGLKWPENVAPFKIHLITHLDKSDEQVNNQIQKLAWEIYNGEVENFENGDQKIAIESDEVLWDDRQGVSLGEKFADAELIGCPVQVIISKRSLENGGVEIKMRS